MSSHELITSNDLPMPPESHDSTELPAPKTWQSSTISLDRLNRWASWGIAVVLFVVGSFWSYSHYLDTKNKAAERQSITKPPNAFSLLLWANGSKRDQDEAQKRFQHNVQGIQDVKFPNITWELEEQMRRTQQQFKSAFENLQQPQFHPSRFQQGQQNRRPPRK
ncbi:MAG: hypothetical protein JXB07_02145 [Anaerolineae bacterium]|nr:hypothetical protein [Anaerolineae bacterium]